MTAPTILLSAWAKEVYESSDWYARLAPGALLSAAEDFASEWWRDEYALDEADSLLSESGDDDTMDNKDHYLGLAGSTGSDFAEKVAPSMVDLAHLHLATTEGGAA